MEVGRERERGGFSIRSLDGYADERGRVGFYYLGNRNFWCSFSSSFFDRKHSEYLISRNRFETPEPTPSSENARFLEFRDDFVNGTDLEKAAELSKRASLIQKERSEAYL